jgi:recombination protein RecA
MSVASGKIGIAVVDSVSALVPQAEIDGEMGDSHMGLQARLMGQAMRKINGFVSKTNTLVIFINQLRQKIGVVFGNPETTSGGNALKFYSSVRMDIRAIGKIKGKTKKKSKDDETKAKIIGNKVRIKIIKNKLAPPFKTIETDLIFGHGFNKEGEILDLGYDLDIVEMSGSWYSYRDERIGQGKSAACKALRKNPSLADSIMADIRIAQGS